MDHQRWERIKTIFQAALGCADIEQQSILLDRECDGDSELRREIESLLAAGHAELIETGEGARAVAGLESTINQPPVSEQPGQRIGNYKLLELIDEGGMGSVWIAEQTEPVRRKVALKLIKPGMDSRQVLARFEAERQALAMMDHPNIAKVFDAGLTDEQRPYFVMEYIKGLPFIKFCDDSRLCIEDRLKLFVQICQAVHHAHQKGIIHRDLKPNNILIALYDGQPVPKVIDFGLAKALYQPLTERTLHTGHETVLGTPLYMSPEQAELNNLDIDTRSDIYSLGVLLYELLTGSTPLEQQRFRQAAWAEVLRVIKEEEPAKPSLKLNSSGSLPSIAAARQTEPTKLSKVVQGDLDWIVMKALEKDRTRRYETATGFAQDIQRYLRNEAVEACPPSMAYRLRKFVRKNKSKVMATSAITAVLILGIIGTGIGMMIADQNRRDAERARNAERLADEESLKQTDLAAQRAAQIEWQSYVSNVRMAGAAMNLRQFHRVRECLDNCPKKHRNWEWRWLNARADSSLLTLSGHAAAVDFVEFGSEGSWIATASGDNTVRIWNAENGQIVSTIEGDTHQFNSVSFSPDRKRVVTTSPDGIARVWDIYVGN